ncbi:Pls/PosA family non-ribosomal peptide synthetase [Arthrobacter crystallopoietes]|uniref:Pls/PosA family non-ribosomal peptide synthetase n=1 Tax=Crystallibacter crystallopoietes TaxID=37928 RepID=UPI001ABE6226|nr:Pls/PosA family non-ribosomal peptide synthetase [Arthrobacter crystallopoietes]QTG80133.1 peptide synthetase [Arthrobacter crystallopoietes]
MNKSVDTLSTSPGPTIPIIPTNPAAQAGNGSPTTPASGAGVALERRLADLLASVVKKDDVPVDANFFYELGADSLVMAQFCARVRKQPDLPAVSIKDIYQHPTIAALAASLAPVEEPTAQVQDRLAMVLAGVLGVEHVPVDANFFHVLGADSLVMAQFCARVRKQPDLPAISIKDIYQHPTIAALAAALAPATSPVQERLAEVLGGVLGIDHVPVDSDFFQDLGADSLLMAKFCARVRKQPDLPAVSIKDIYRNPTIAALAAALAPATSPVQERLAEVLGGVLGIDHVPVDSDFFQDLGADSLLMAKFCARVRKQPDLPKVSMKDVYGNPNISALAAALQGPSQQDQRQEPSPALASVPETPRPMDARTWEYVTCGALQALVYVGYCLLAGWLAVVGYQWIFPEAGPGNHQWLGHGMSFGEIYLRSLAFSAATFVLLSILPVAAKWIIIGRFRPHEIRIWSLAYFRFWLVKTLMRTSPLSLMTGSPLTTFYLRAMGAKVGRNVMILTNRLPVCTDLLTIGEGTVIRKDAVLLGYRAHGGVIQVGTLTLGRDVIVGEGSVLDIDTAMGDGSQLAHRSTLYTGQVVPGGERWHGSPGRRTEVDYGGVEATPYRPWRRGWFAISQLVSTLGVGRTMIGLAIALVVLAQPRVAALLEVQPFAFTDWAFYADAVTYAGLTVFGGTVMALVVITTVPRVLQLAVKPDTVYPLFGLRDAAARAVAKLTNSPMLGGLFGDSSYVVNYVRAIGYKQPQVQQTGSNLGTVFKHDNPFLSTIGSGTMIADAVSFMNTDYSATSFKVCRASIGAHNFLGNAVLYPAGAKTGDNCLLATKVMVPIDGPVRRDVGLLGSPAFEIPRSVLRDALPEEHASRTNLRRDLAAKNKHNRHSMALLMLTRWLNMSLALVIMFAALELSDQFGFLAFSGSFVVMLLVGLLVPIGIERLATGLRPLQPQLCSIYNPYFWWHERYWKMSLQSRYAALLNGTPFKPLVWRLLGVRMGARVFDDGCGIIEKTLVTVGSRCTLNAGSTVQSHSQEDGMFKSDHNVIGDDVTLGVGAFVHYGVTVEDGAVVAADSFVMKGTILTSGSLWSGNPAEEARSAITSPIALERPLS